MEKRIITDLSVLISISIIPSLIIQIVPHYDMLMPKIEKDVFEQLAQINATILGFTLVGIFYYMGKIDERGKEFLKGYQEIIQYNIKYSLVLDEYADELERVIKNKKHQSPLVNNYLEIARHQKQTSQKDRDMMYDSMGKINNLFGATTRYMRFESAYITILLGMAIVLCLISLIYFANGAGQSTWKGLTSIVFLLGGVTYSFYRFWSDAQSSVDMLDDQTLAFNIFKLKKEEQRQRDSK